MKLVEQYKKMVFKIANTVQAKHNGMLDMSALESAALQGICEAERTFNPDSTAILKTWVFIHARRQVQAEACKQRKQLTENINTTSQRCAHQDNALDIMSVVDRSASAEDQINREQLHALLMEQVRKLPAAEQKLMIKILARGMTLTEWAEEEGVTPQRASYLYRGALEQLQRTMRRYQSEVCFS
jgi:RNA polymerase sigma factor (sigma-70 family)